MTDSTQAAPGTALLRVEDLHVAFGGREVVHGVSYEVRRGEILSIVGESGSGKSVTVKAIAGLHGRGTSVTADEVTLDGRDLLALRESELRDLRGREMSMIFQDPMSSLNPAMTVRQQIAQVIRSHETVTRQAAGVRACELLDLVGIPQPERQLDRYPHQLSGGMRQRVIIAMAVSCSPSLLIADEPTTALDVTVQAQILDVLLAMRIEYGMSIILITHDLGVVAQIADRVAVMHDGEIVESGTVDEVLVSPRHEYTRSLLDSIPRVTTELNGRATA